LTATEPAVSIGLAVRNGENVVPRCIDSVLAQEFADLELVVCDNASTDGTTGVLEEYARADPRVRVNVNAENIGIHENMNRVLNLAGGTLFRWISGDDWLEPGYLTATMQALESAPEAIGVTTYFTIHTDDGATWYEEYAGEFPSSPDPARRFERMLWFFLAGDAKYDPIYGLYRRDALLRSGRERASEQSDWLLSAELALMGPIVHVPERLAHRTRSYPPRVVTEARRRRLDPSKASMLSSPPWRLYRDLQALVEAADLTDAQARRCRAALRRFFARDNVSRVRGRLAAWRHRLVDRELEV
jgi:glycosyltransferase involved in cell wall biosynthesis